MAAVISSYGPWFCSFSVLSPFKYFVAGKKKVSLIFS